MVPSGLKRCPKRPSFEYSITISFDIAIANKFNNNCNFIQIVKQTMTSSNKTIAINSSFDKNVCVLLFKKKRTTSNDNLSRNNKWASRRFLYVFLKDIQREHPQQGLIFRIVKIRTLQIPAGSLKLTVYERPMLILAVLSVDP